MSFGVALFMDEKSEAAVRRVWRTVRDAGISSFMVERGIRPHLTLAVYGELDVDSFLAGFSSFANEISPVSFSFTHAGVFLDPGGVVFLAPTVTYRLMNLHARFHARFQALGHSLAAYSLPGKWLPHVTVAAGLNEDGVREAIRIAGTVPFPAQSVAEEIGIGEFDYIPGTRAYTTKWVYNLPLGS